MALSPAVRPWLYTTRRGALRFRLVRGDRLIVFFVALATPVYGVDAASVVTILWWWHGIVIDVIVDM